LLQSKSWDQISVRDIAASAAVGYTTFFRHFPGKESLLQAVASDEIAHLIRLTMPVLDATDTRAACLALCRFVNQHRALWLVLLTGGAAGVLREEFVRQSMRVAAERSQPGHWLPAEAAVVIVSSATIELLAWWLRQQKPLSIERIAEIYDRIIVAPVVHSAAARTASPKSRR
jgi:AcrR family transcriptional regulator